MKRTFSLRLRTGDTIHLPKPAVMGIINVSPNSFFNPNLCLDDALKTAESMVFAGADILDIGGEATNPRVNLTAELPSLQVELDRVCPVVAAIRQRFDVLISVYTSRKAVMHEVVSQGADIINDQR